MQIVSPTRHANTMLGSLLISYLLSALLAFIISTLVLATFGWSLGVRRLYVRNLLKIFKVKIQCLFEQSL